MGIENLIITVVSTGAVVASYFVILAFQTTDALSKITPFDQYIGGGILGGIAFWFFKWLLKRNDSLTKLNNDLHEQMLEQNAKHNAEIKELLLREKND